MKVRYTFEVVKYWTKKTLPCPECGKRVLRAKTFEQTINPYNVLPDGTIKNREAIMQELAQQAKKWRDVPEVCGKCRGRGE